MTATDSNDGAASFNSQGPQTEARIKSTAVDLGTPGEDDTCGAGRINAAAAV